MNPSLPSYMIVGAIGFLLLSVLATKYRGDEIQGKHLVRDAVAGSMFTAFVLVLVPDMFPPLSLLSGLGETVAAAKGAVMRGGAAGVDDFDLQVGYMRRR